MCFYSLVFFYLFNMCIVYRRECAVFLQFLFYVCIFEYIFEQKAT